MSVQGRFRVPAVGLFALLLALTLAGCGGSSSSADSSPSESPTPSPSPSATKPALAAQPNGKYGVTYHVVNWAGYAKDPAVLAWKQTFEVLGASTNQKKVLPALTALGVKRALRQLVSAVHYSSSHDLHVPPVGTVRVKSVRTTGAVSHLVLCVWAPSTGYYQSNGKYYGKREVFWYRQQATMKKIGDRWRLAAFDYSGRCKGGAPR